MYAAVGGRLLLLVSGISGLVVAGVLRGVYCGGGAFKATDTHTRLLEANDGTRSMASQGARRQRITSFSVQIPVRLRGRLFQLILNAIHRARQLLAQGLGHFLMVLGTAPSHLITLQLLLARSTSG